MASKELITKRCIIKRIFGERLCPNLDYENNNKAFAYALSLAESRGLLQIGEREFYLSFYS